MRSFSRAKRAVTATAAAVSFVLTGTAAAAAPSTPTTPTTSSTADAAQPQIVGGHAPSHAYPAGAYAAVTYDAPKDGVTNHFTCGAAQLSGYIVRLAAHCVTDPPAGLSAEAKAALMRFYGVDAVSMAVPTADKQFWVRVGSPDRTSGGVLVRASIHWVEPGWNWGMGPGESDDIAELQVDRYLDSYALPIAPRPAQPGDTVFRLGWGGTEPVFDGHLPRLIQELQSQVVSADKCASAAITARDVCVDNPGGVKGDCYGDSGGPLLTMIDGVWYDVGVTSRGGSEICGATPDVYTSTPEFTAELYAAMQNPAPVLAHGTPIR